MFRSIHTRAVRVRTFSLIHHFKGLACDVIVPSRQERKYTRRNRVADFKCTRSGMRGKWSLAVSKLRTFPKAYRSDTVGLRQHWWRVSIRVGAFSAWIQQKYARQNFLREYYAATKYMYTWAWHGSQHIYTPSVKILSRLKMREIFWRFGDKTSSSLTGDEEKFWEISRKYRSHVCLF